MVGNSSNFLFDQIVVQIANVISMTVMRIAKIIGLTLVPIDTSMQNTVTIVLHFFQMCRVTLHISKRDLNMMKIEFKATHNTIILKFFASDSV